MSNPYKFRFFTLTIGFLLFLNCTKGQNAFSSISGARGIGVGNSNLVYQDIYSGFNNQAGLAHLEGFSGAVFTENRFLLNELQLLGLSIANPINSGTVGMTLQYFGFSAYNEQKIGLNYSRKLLEGLSIGAQFDFLNTRIKEYGSASAITFELGLQYEILEKIIAGVHVYNPIRVSLGTDELPSILQIGITYQATDYITISGSIEKDTYLPYNFRFGFEYELLNKIHLRAGVNSQSNRFSFGVGYSVNQLHLNIAASYHETLGFSPAFGVSYQPTKEKKKKGRN